MAKPLIINPRDLAGTAEETAYEIGKRFHPAAREALEEDKQTVQALQDWLRDRFERLAKEAGDIDNSFVNLGKTPYNTQNGIGLQSIGVKTFKTYDPHEEPEELLLQPSEYKRPTIGVIADGMVGKNAAMIMQEFPIEKGFAEVLRVLSETLYVGPSDFALTIKRGNSVIVHGPEAVRTYCQLVRKKVTNPAEISTRKHKGAYACEYWND